MDREVNELTRSSISYYELQLRRIERSWWLLNLKCLLLSAFLMLLKEQSLLIDLHDYRRLSRLIWL